MNLPHHLALHPNPLGPLEPLLVWAHLFEHLALEILPMQSW